MGSEKKRELINVAYKLLEERQIIDLTPREIAEAANCSVDDIYEIFGDMDHLIYLAAAQILDEYTQQCQKNIDSITDPIELEMALWKNFLPYVFRYIDVYELLFWNTRKSLVTEAMKEYYDLYPERKTEIKFSEMFFSADLKDRGATVLNKAAAAGYFKEEDVNVLVNLSVGLLYNMMATYKNIFRTDGIPDRVAEKYLAILESLYSHYRLK